MQSILSFVLLTFFCVTLGEEEKVFLRTVDNLEVKCAIANKMYVTDLDHLKKERNGQVTVTAPYIQRCDIDEENLPECIKEQIVASLPHFTKGVPELKVPSLDPVHLDDIKIDGNGLLLKFTEAAMHGLSNAELTDLKLNLGDVDEEFSLSFKSNLSLTAQYEVDGRILILPIKGKGDALVFAQGVQVRIDSKLIHVKNSKGEHLKLVTPTYKYDIERTTFDLKNLFNGNKQLADTTIQFANQNWRQLMDELAPPAIKQIVVTCVKAINKFFSNIPIGKLVIGYKERL